MSITAKQYLLKTLGAELCRSLTAADLQLVQEKLNDVLAGFEVETTANVKHDAEGEDFLAAFVDAKRIAGCSEKTIRLYTYRIRQLLDAVDVPVRHVTVFHLRKYLMEQKQAGIADKTLESTRSIYCSFFGWLHREGLLLANPCANLAPIKCAQIVRLPYSDVDLEKLSLACEGNRNKAIMAFLLSTGCRVSEMCGLNRDDVDFAHSEAVVLGKGNKQRTVFLSDVAVMYLEDYLKERTDDRPELFSTRQCSRITPNAVRRMLHETADRAGVQDVHPHRFRRTLATNLIGHGMPIQDVAQVLGHEKLDTTLGYTYRAKEDIKSNYKKYA